MIYEYIKKKYGQRLQRYHKNRLEESCFSPITDVRDPDFFITGYPKSGNTWMQRIVSGLVYGVNPKYLPDKLAQELVPDIYSFKYFKRFHSKIQCFKSHELPKKEYKHVIYIVRDGRDSMCSYYAMLKSIGQEHSLKDIIEKGEGVYPCKWFQHVRGWLDNPYNANIIYIRYEDLHKSPKEQLLKICKFFNIERTELDLKTVIEGASFSNLKRLENEEGHYNSNLDIKRNFFRKGKIGSYKTEMPAELQRYFVNEAYKELAIFNYVGI